MAASTTTTTQLKLLSHTIKPKCRRYRETTITTSTSTSATTSEPPISTTPFPPQENHHHQFRKLITPSVVSPDNSWCCPASKPPPPPSPPTHIATSGSPSPPSNIKIRYSPTTPQRMDTYSAAAATVYGAAASAATNHDGFPTSLSKFNNALTAGLLNPHSPPPSIEKTTRSSPTLFEMMANEPDCLPQRPPPFPHQNVAVPPNYQNHQKALPLDKQALLQQRLLDLLACKSPGNQFNDAISSDVKLTLSSKDGLSIAMCVHRQILVAHSRFFAEKLCENWAKQQRNSGPYIVEIADCDDVEVYIETLRLMYCRDLRKKLMREDVPKVLGILKVSAAIGFDAGVLSCLEYLEAAPWAEDEEEKVASLLAELQLDALGAGEVLKRVSLDVTAGADNRNENEEILLKLLHVVLEGKDEKARREMKALVSKMLHENSSQNEMRKESLYSACDGCLQLLRDSFLQAAEARMQNVSQISRQADNLHWILDILIDRQIADDFLRTWASQSDVSEAHSKVPPIHRYEVSRVTARLFVGIGKGQLLATKETRCLLMQTWLVPFYNDFAWMRRASRGLDRHLIEEGLTNTILTLPMSWQQEILMSWFDRFLNSGEDCPNIQRGFETWWRRAFWRRSSEPDRPRQLRIMNGPIENS